MLRPELLKLAHANPELRAHLLPLLEHAAQDSFTKEASGGVFAQAIIAVVQDLNEILDVGRVVSHNMRMLSQLGKDAAVVLANQADKTKEMWASSTGQTMFQWLKTPDGQGIVSALHFLRDVIAPRYEVSEQHVESPGHDVFFVLRALYTDIDRIKNTMPFALQYEKNRKVAALNPHVPRDLPSRLYAIHSLLGKLISKSEAAGEKFQKLMGMLERIYEQTPREPRNAVGSPPPIVAIMHNFKETLPGYWHHDSEPLSLMIEAFKSVHNDIGLLKATLKV